MAGRGGGVVGGSAKSIGEKKSPPPREYTGKKSPPPHDTVGKICRPLPPMTLLEKFVPPPPRPLFKKSMPLCCCCAPTTVIIHVMSLS